MRRSWLLVAAAGVALVAAGLGNGAARLTAGPVAPTTTTAPIVVVPLVEDGDTGARRSVEAPPPGLATTAPPTTAPGFVGVISSPRGVVLPVLAAADGRFTAVTPCGSTTITAGTMVGPVDVVLDAGHGGQDSGAVAPDGFKEKDLNLAVLAYAQRALTAQGLRVLPTRTGDYLESLGGRAAISAGARPKVFVSIHHNAEPDGPSTGPGTETYYQRRSPDSKRLAGLIQEEVVAALATVPDVSWSADRDAGAKFRTNVNGDDYYAMIRRTAGTPAALAELGFLTNPSETAAFHRPEVQQLEGEAVARGIVRYLGTSDPGSGFVTPYERPSPAPSGDAGGPLANCVDPPL